MSSHVHNVTVPWVPLADFDWSFARSGPLPWNQTVWSIIAVFTALPLWMTFELTVWIFYSFQEYGSLYFWSVLACTWGTTIHALGFVLKICVPQCNWILATVLAEIGWVGMVTGFSVVLYSRLGVLVAGAHKRTWLNFTLAMIVMDAFLFHVPTIVFQFGVSNAPTHAKYLPFMAPMERVQVMAFSIQETIISAMYIYHTLKYLRESLHKDTRKTIALLIWVQVIVILCDVLVITLDYCEYFSLKAVIHSFVYAFKLQLEFVILNDVKAMAQKGRFALSNPNSGQVYALRRDDGSPKSSAVSSGKGYWRSFGLRLHTQKGSEETQLEMNVRNHGSIGSITSGNSSAAHVTSGSHKLANNGFITTHPVTEAQRGIGNEELDMERQYLGRW
ncbi:Nn.00g013120.m01.CDS01 [Neocucurbitaria sp. VM-36]